MKAWIIAAVILILVIVIYLIAQECPNGPKIGIEIVPHTVNVGAEPSTFELEARLWTGPAADRRSITEAQSYTVTWSVTAPWLKVKSQTGFKAIIEVLPSAPSTGSAYVRAKAGGSTSNPDAKITLVPDVVVNGDMLSSEYIPDKAPDAVVVNGINDVAGSPCKLTLSAFVRRSMLGKIVDVCSGDEGGWGAAVLAVNHGVLFTPAAWSGPDNTVQAGPAQLPLRSLPAALRVMIGSTLLDPAALTTLRNDILQIAKDEIAATNSILAAARAGIQLTIHDPQVIVVPEEVNITGCLGGDALTAARDAPEVLNVYYVNDLTGVRGLACGGHGRRKQDVIYVGMALHSTTTFAHELGHTLGLTLPGFGHSDNIAGVDRTNVMTGGENDLDSGGRRRLTVGQVFRMNADSASWLNWAIDPADPLKKPIREREAPRLACQCGEADPAGRCPRLVEDVALPSSVPGSASSWDCVDRLGLTGVSEEEPVALLAGRRWRAPPGTCRPDIPALADTRWGATYVKFANLTRSGDCPSWVAIFFREHGVKYLELADDAYTWTTVAEEWWIPDETVPRIKIDVSVHYPSAHGGIVDQDIDDALKTFGSSNRSGIELLFDKRPGIACPTGSLLPLELNLCYITAGTEEARLAAPGRILVTVPHRTETTVSHFIGRALGLKELSDGDLSLALNIMQPEPIKRGQKLTLGQVFRIYATLDPTLQCDPGPCPSLGADIAP